MKLVVLAISLLTVATLARADRIDLEEGISPELPKVHHSNKLHSKEIKVEKDKGDKDQLTLASVAEGSTSHSFRVDNQTSFKLADAEEHSTVTPVGTWKEKGGDDDGKQLAPVPEPGTLLLLVTGLLMGAVAVRKRMIVPQ